MRDGEGERGAGLHSQKVTLLQSYRVTGWRMLMLLPRGIAKISRIEWDWRPVLRGGAEVSGVAESFCSRMIGETEGGKWWRADVPSWGSAFPGRGGMWMKKRQRVGFRGPKVALARQGRPMQLPG